jgi:prevent-host-death family protein
MEKVPTIIPITDLRQDAATVLRRVRESKGPVVITQRGRAAAILISAEAYERSERDHELLRLLARGEKEIAARTGHSLDAVLAEADALLAEGDR